MFIYFLLSKAPGTLEHSVLIGLEQRAITCIPIVGFFTQIFAPHPLITKPYLPLPSAYLVITVVKMFRLAAFNVLAHNRDDHAKNFTFLMDSNGLWRLSPAYDLIFSSGPRGEQSMMGE